MYSHNSERRQKNIDCDVAELSMMDSFEPHQHYLQLEEIIEKKSKLVVYLTITYTFIIAVLVFFLIFI